MLHAHIAIESTMAIIFCMTEMVGQLLHSTSGQHQDHDISPQKEACSSQRGFQAPLSYKIDY